MSEKSVPHAEIQEDEIPTAGPPKSREEGYGTSGTAFEALAAAGSALSGAFSAVTGIRQEESSENWDSPEALTRDSTPIQERPSSLSPIQEVPSVASSIPPSPPAKDSPYEQSKSQEGYFPSPLKASSSVETQTPMRPQMLPALSTDYSPQDTESDRLRKEIVRSLTPKSTKADIRLGTVDERESLPTTTHAATSGFTENTQSNVDSPVSEDDKSWDKHAQKDSVEMNTESQLEQSEDERFTPSHTEEIQQQSAGNLAGTGGRPMLQKRFSWEASTESVGTLARSMDMAATSIPQSQVSDTTDSPGTIRTPTDSMNSAIPLHSKSSDDDTAHKIQNRPTIIPVADSQESLDSGSPVHIIANVVDESRKSVDSISRHQPVIGHDSDHDPAVHSSTPILAPKVAQHPDKPILPMTASQELSFREILSMKTPQERITAYNNTRQQVATQESGLAMWLQASGSQYPEHQVLFHRNGRPFPGHAGGAAAHKPSPSRSKFPRIGASLGGGAQQPHAETPDGSKPSSGSPSSGKLTSQQVQEEGKKLLQSAGKIGGKAGGAARGLFAKGKNKLRASSGGEKVDA